MDIKEIRDKINEYKSNGKKIFVSSSFQSYSLVLLHIISRIDSEIPVYFINTGFHFPETIVFKNKISKLFGLKVIDLNPVITKNYQIDINGNLLYTSDPDYCCYLNKVYPMEQILMNYDVWISGLRAEQNQNRKNLNIEEHSTHNVLRYHPLLFWNSEKINKYINEYKLSMHPLEEKGFKSIGCEPCTRKANNSNEREGRWFGLKKNECGLHTELIVKK
ncbi:MAG: phosphoadenylyl-sulfate reductase [Bacteroidota bacterium]|nr:phosphoadenylyl-sulfate reductase [Bacteroidota bacterium]